jgi:hypothetical protein
LLAASSTRRSSSTRRERRVEQALIEVLTDEPAWRHLLFITPIELAGPDAASLN